MTGSLIEQYKMYYNTDEHYAVDFVKKNLLDSENRWVNILYCNVGEGNNIRKLEFEYVVCEIFLKKLLPAYPPKEYFSNIEDYILNCEAIIWDTAKRDIAEQKRCRIKGHKYSLTGRRIKVINENYDGSDTEPQEIEQYKVVYVKRLNPDKPLFFKR